VKRVLVVGDILLDRYTKVTTERKAQEADIPVYDRIEYRDDIYNDDDVRLGGAANVATNIKTLAGDEVEVTVSGILNATLVGMLIDSEIFPGPFQYAEFGLLSKHRYVCDNKIIFRVDNKKRFDDKDIKNFERKFSIDSDFDAIVISDYDKGTVTQQIAEKIIESGVPTIVDSKAYDLRKYTGAKFLNINEDEFSRQVSNRLYTNIESLFDFVLVTMGPKGSELRQLEKIKSNDRSYTVHSEHFPTTSVPVVDVTGCGDTHTAAFSLGVMRDPTDVRNAVRYANKSATLAVQKFGTTRISRWDFSKSLQEE